MYSPIQLDIIRTFGSKQLNQGCLIKIENDYFHLMEKYDKWTSYRWFEIPIGSKMLYVTDTEIEYNKNIEILWHIPHLFPDVAKVAKEKWWEYELLANPDWHELFIYGTWVKLFHIPYHPTLPLLDQSEETLTQLLNLFK